MKKVTVYRVDYVRRTKTPIGHVIERRTKERGDNLIGLLHLARKAYSRTAEDAIRIAVDQKEARFA